MKIPDDKKEMLIKEINGYGFGTKICQVCGKSNWSIDEHIFQLSEFHEGKILAPGVVIPLVSISCGNCGNTITMSAIKLGVVEPQKKAEDK